MAGGVSDVITTVGLHEMDRDVLTLGVSLAYLGAVTVSIALAPAISIILSSIGPLWTIATAPSAPSASLLTSLGPMGSMHRPACR